MKKIFLTLFILTISFGCKEEKKDDNKPADKETEVSNSVNEKENIFRIEISGVFNEDGIISLNYLNDANLKFNSTQYLVKKFSGNIEQQTIQFELPKDEFLEKFRFRPTYLSNEPKDMQINEIKVSFNNSTIVLNPSNYKQFLLTNPYVTINENDSIFKFQKKEINGSLIFDPYIITNPTFTQEILLQL